MKRQANQMSMLTQQPYLQLPPSPHIRPSDSKAPSLKSVKDLDGGGGHVVKAVVVEGAAGRKKTMKELDEELREKLESMSGEGGGAGVEYEGGKAVGLKRGVRENMFRVI